MIEPDRCRTLVAGEQPDAVAGALEAHGIGPIARCRKSKDFSRERFGGAITTGVLCDASDVSVHALEQWPAMPLVLAGPAVDLASPALESSGLVLRVPADELGTIGPRIENYLNALDSGHHALVAADEQSRKLSGLARQVADSDATILLQGESGTGKEVFARYLHANSSRADQPFVAVNCAAIPETMLEAILFGHEKGAFTGADVRRAGKFGQAHGGTLLLDEISEMDLNLQAKLLRVLQEREIEPLGSGKTQSVDVRVIATTNRRLNQAVSQGQFRRDLFYRLSVFPIALPPLRERTNDIVPLALRLAWRHAAMRGVRRFSAAALRRLRQHRWPGNVRELDNVIQRAVLLSETVDIDADLIQLELVTEEMESERLECLDDWLRRREHQLIASTLESNHGDRAATARRLGISPRTLRYKLAQMRDAGVAIPA